MGLGAWGAAPAAAVKREKNGEDGERSKVKPGVIS